MSLPSFEWWLSPEEEERIERLLSGDDKEALTFHYRLVLSRQDYRSTQGDEWFNDHIINSYLELLSSESEDVVSVSTFFYPALSRRPPPKHKDIRSWTRRLAIFAQRTLLIPIFEKVTEIVLHVLRYVCT